MLKKVFHKNNIVHAALILVALATLILVGHVGVSSTSHKNEWQLFKAPEKTMELYFTHHLDLPKRYSPGTMSTVAFTATAHDSESEYRYEIVQENAGGDASVVLKDGVIRVSNSQPQAIEVPILYVEGGTRSKIVVRIPEQGQSVHYWVERQS